MLTDYKSNKALLLDLVKHTGGMDDNDILKQAGKSLLRCSTAELEFKATRHVLRGRKKKELLLSRISEFTSATDADWKMHVHEGLVTLYEKTMQGPGP